MNPRQFSVSVILTILLPGCTGPQAEHPAPEVTGNPVRDTFEKDLYRLKTAHAVKSDVLETLGGRATRIADPFVLESLPHAPNSEVTIPLHVMADWKKQMARSGETIYVMAEDGNDILLFFDKSGRLEDYVHM